MPEDPNAPEIRKYIEELARKGIRLSQTQVWVLVKTYDRHLSIKELAQERGITHQAMWLACEKLESLRLIDKSYMINREWYYICRFDLSETADFSLRVKYQKQTFNTEELIGYLMNAANIQRIPNYIGLALMFLYNRSIKKEKEQKLEGPTPSEVRSFLLSLIGDLEEFTAVVRQLAEMKLFELSNTHEAMGHMSNHNNTQEIIDYFDSDFILRWENKVIGVKGLIGAEKPKTYSENFYETWMP
jgi:hypothetical protein